MYETTVYERLLADASTSFFISQKPPTNSILSIRVQFHQRFMRSFYVSKLRAQLFVLMFQVCTLLVQDCLHKSCAQNVGAKRKYAVRYSSRPFSFTEKITPQLYHYAQLEIMLNFYAVRFTIYASKTWCKPSGTKTADRTLMKLSPKRIGRARRSLRNCNR